MNTETYITENNIITIEFEMLDITTYVWKILKNNEFCCKCIVPYATKEGMYESARLKVYELFPNATLKDF